MVAERRHGFLPGRTGVVFDDDHLLFAIGSGYIEEVGTWPKEVFGLICQNFFQSICIDGWPEVTVTVDDLLFAQIEKKADQGVDGGIECLGVPMIFRLELTR